MSGRKEDSSSDIHITSRLIARPTSGERVLLVGDGPVARALGSGLDAAGARLERWWRRQSRPLPSADVVVLAVRDEAISDVAKQVMKTVGGGDAPPILLHCAGALPAATVF